MRVSGILMPLFSLYSKEGIGGFGQEAYEFIDYLFEADQSIWQVLPLTPIGSGNSPYSTKSSFGLFEGFISIQKLFEESLLDNEDLFVIEKEYIDYEEVLEKKYICFKKAFSRFNREDEDFIRFVDINISWLKDYALFCVLSEKHGNQWKYWQKEVRKREEETLEELYVEHAEEMQFIYFLQYFAFKQWSAVKDYAHLKNIKIMGDIPIYVMENSFDAWVYQDRLLLDEFSEKLYNAGTPPDAFSVQGQNWQMPIYDWDNLKENGYDYWILRLKSVFEHVDMLRLDHFRGFINYWQIPKDEPAVFGSWQKGPGLDFFNFIFEYFPKEKFIAEDLGMIDDEVRGAIKELDIPGMNVLTFAFNPNERSLYLPHNHKEKDVVYIGTHDNQTLRGYIDNLDEKEKKYISDYLETEDIEKAMISAALRSVCKIAIIQIQDILGLDDSYRTNTPGTTEGNWKWIIPKDYAKRNSKYQLKYLTWLYVRNTIE